MPVIESYLRLRPKHRRKSSVLFNYDIFKEYLTDVIDKREYWHGWVIFKGAYEPGWFSYIELYKGSVQKLRAQMQLVTIGIEEEEKGINPYSSESEISDSESCGDDDKSDCGSFGDDSPKINKM